MRLWVHLSYKILFKKKGVLSINCWSVNNPARLNLIR